MMGWCIGILLLIVGFVLFMIPGSQTIGWILWMAGIVCFGGQGFINYRKSSNPTEGMAASSLAYTAARHSLISPGYALPC